MNRHNWEGDTSNVNLGRDSEGLSSSHSPTDACHALYFAPNPSLQKHQGSFRVPILFSDVFRRYSSLSSNQRSRDAKSIEGFFLNGDQLFESLKFDKVFCSKLATPHVKQTCKRAVMHLFMLLISRGHATINSLAVWTCESYLQSNTLCFSRCRI